MPELPDVVVYIEALERRLLDRRLETVRLGNPFVLRTVDPPLERAAGRRVVSLNRIGKRIAIELEGGLYLVIHLMIAGRLRWHKRGAGLPGRRGLVAFDFEHGTLLMTEAGTKKRASLHVVAGEAALAELDPGGLEVMDASLAAFREAITRGGPPPIPFEELARTTFAAIEAADCIRSGKTFRFDQQ